MLAADMDMCATNAVFDAGPEAFDGVGVDFAAHVFLRPMIDRIVIEAVPANAGVCAPFVRTDFRAAFDVFKNVRMQGFGPGIGDDPRHHVTIALDHAENNGLVDLPSAPTEFVAPANVSFVNFDVARQPIVAVDLRHIFAKFMAHAPRRLVRHAKLPLKLFSRDAMAGRSEQIHGVEPLLKRRAGALKRRSNHRINVMATIRTLIGWALRPFMKSRFLAALGTFEASAVADLHHMRQTGVVIGKLAEELLDCVCLFHTNKYGDRSYRCQGDNHRKLL